MIRTVQAVLQDSRGRVRSSFSGRPGLAAARSIAPARLAKRSVRCAAGRDACSLWVINVGVLYMPTEWHTAVVWPDKRRDYGEFRMVALGYIGLRIMSIVFVDRPPEQPTERRIISLRKANTREVKRYAET